LIKSKGGEREKTKNNVDRKEKKKNTRGKEKKKLESQALRFSEIWGIFKAASQKEGELV